MKRWHAIIVYWSDNGAVTVEHDIEEIEDLHDIVERGPTFYSIQSILITLNRKDSITVEDAAKE